MKKPIILVISLLALLAVGFFFLQGAVPSNSLTDDSREGAGLNEAGSVHVTPISHASLVLTLGDTTIFVDPVEDATWYTEFGFPDLILLTDTDSDHLDLDTLTAVVGPDTILIAPQAVSDELSESLQARTVVMGNGDRHAVVGVGIEAVPMYNLPERADSYHVKGRGNGYVLSQAGTRVYIAGDTSDTPEMRALENIDIAFIPMNPPYTMAVDVAADAVLDFAPAIVYPYHYRGPDGFANIDEFERIVNEGNPDIDVRIVDWYPVND